MIKNKLRKAFMLSVVFLSTSTFYACEKFQENTLGKEVQPEDDLLGPGATDTLTLLSKTVRADSVISDELSNNLLGAINESVFGKLNCATYAQFRLASSNVTFGTAQLSVDSVVLSLGIAGYYGDTNTVQEFLVKRLVGDMRQDSVYYSNSSIAAASNLVNEGGVPTMIAPRPTSRVVVGNDTLAAQIRIRLEKSLGESFLAKENEGNLVDNTKFLEFFKGLQISSAPLNSLGGAVVYLSPISSLSQITVYYKEDNTVAKTFSINITTSSARFTSFNADYIGSPVQQQLDGMISGDDATYVQSGGLLKTQILFPNIDLLKSQDVTALNKAELIMPVFPGSTSPLAPHAKLSIFLVTEDDKREIVIDQFEGDAHFDGAYRAAENRIRLNITRAFQQHLSGSKRFKALEIVANSTSVTANRTILAGVKNTSVKPKIILTYTKL